MDSLQLNVPQTSKKMVVKTKKKAWRVKASKFILENKKV
jgi:hypothetical protein